MIEQCDGGNLLGIDIASPEFYFIGIYFVDGLSRSPNPKNTLL